MQLDRDAGWSTTTFWTIYETTHPITRLISWAERGPYRGYDPAVIEAAAVPLAWTLTSPNRFLRDAATKALGTLFVDNLGVAERVIRRFVRCDDPYVTERLAAAAYGALLRVGRDLPDAAAVTALLEALVEMLDVARPNLLLRDHVAGVARFLRDRLQQTEASALIERALPPYGSSPPARPSRNQSARAGLPAPSAEQRDRLRGAAALALRRLR